MIEVREMRRVESDYPHYEIRYTHPHTGADHVHQMPVEAVASRAELLNISHEEALELILNEPYAPVDEVSALYTEAMDARDRALENTSRVHKTQNSSAPRAFNATVAAVDSAPVNTARVESLRAWEGVAAGPGWEQARKQLENDEEELHLYRALLVAAELAQVYGTSDI